MGRYAECHCAGCSVVVLLSAVMLNVVMLSVVVPANIDKIIHPTKNRSYKTFFAPLSGVYTVENRAKLGFSKMEQIY